MGISPYCGSVRERPQATGALPLDLTTLGSCEATVKKRSTENFPFLDKILKFAA